MFHLHLLLQQQKKKKYDREADPPQESIRKPNRAGDTKQVFN